MEGPLAPVQVPQTASWTDGEPSAGSPETPALWVLGFPLQLLQVVLPLLVLHRLGLVALAIPLLLLQLLLQPLLPSQLSQWESLQVQIFLLFPLPLPDPSLSEELFQGQT